MATMLFLVGGGCTDRSPGPRPGGAGEDAGTWGAAGVVEELRIGVDAGPTELMFGYIGAIAVRLDGSLYVADMQAHAVRMFDAEGNYVRDVGGKGQGPGEYQDIRGLRVLPDGNLATWDQLSRRISFFTPEGEYIRSFEADSNSFSDVNDLAIDMAGNLYIRGVLRNPLPPGATRSEAAPGPQPVGPSGVLPVSLQPVYLKYSAEGDFLGEVPLPPEESDPQPGFVLNEAQGVLLPFTIATSFCWSPLGYLVVGRNDTYKIDLRSPDAISLSRNVPRTAVAAEEHAEWEAITEFLKERSVARGRPRRYPPIPTEKPYFRGLHAGDDGRIWVHRYVEATKRDRPLLPTRNGRPQLTWTEAPTFDVFEPSGTFLGTVVLPDDVRLRVSRGDRVWGVHTDVAGVERIVRLRVHREYQ